MARSDSIRVNNEKKYLAYEAVEIGIAGTFDSQPFRAEIINGLVIDHKCTVAVLQRSVRSQNRVVGLDYASRHLWSRVDSKLELSFFPVVYRKALHKQRGESRTSSSTE